jgi:hypothetical protein
MPMTKQLALIVFLTSAVFAQTRFDGTWEMKMDTLQFSGTPEEYLIDKGMYRCLSCVPRVDVKADGTDYKIAGHEAYYDTIAVKIVDANTVNFVFKKDGKPAATSIETVSADGQTMSEKFSNTMEKEAVVGTAGFTRLSAGPPGAHALSGQWRMDTVRNSSTAGTLTTFESIPGGLKISDGSQTCVAKFDGNDYSIGKSGHATIALKLVDEYTLEETDKRDGKVMTVARMTVSKDGKSMRVESSDKQRGGTMIYTAEKRR